MEGADRNLLKSSVKDKDIPWCTMCLVVTVIALQSVVLYGNYKTGGAINAVGVSSGGWSGVGLDFSGSLHEELDEVMKNLTTKLTEAINKTLKVQSEIDQVLSLASDAAETVLGGNTTEVASLLQTHGMESPEDALPGVIITSLNSVMTMLFSKVIDELNELFETKLKPVLEKAGELIQKFGNKIQDVIESFGVTVDRAQKMFDQVMSQISAGVPGMEEQLIHETYGIFDVNETGTVNVEGLQLVAQIYNVPALRGDNAAALVQKYDADGSGDLDKQEFTLLTEDTALPDITAVVLRSFAKTLSEIAGNVGSAKFRGEIAEQVADYLGLMCAKNQTKVGWISDALGNASLPIQFTADVFVKLALQLDDPQTYTELRTGEKFTDTITKLHPSYTAQVVDMISNSTYWVTEGFNPDDHATVIERVTDWFVKAQKDAGTNLVDTSVLDLMPKLARKAAQTETKAYVMKKHREFTMRYNKMFASETSRHVLLQLNGGAFAASQADSSSSMATRAIASGVPAKPETLLFAKFLSWNASQTADRFQKYCFDKTATSSNTMDGFATQIQSMIKKIKSFIAMMMKYSTPQGISMLEAKFQDFINNSATDLLVSVKQKVDDVVNQTATNLSHGLEDAITEAGQKVTDSLSTIIASPLAEDITPALQGVLAKLVGNESAAGLASLIGGQLAKEITNETDKILQGPLGTMLAANISSMLNTLVDEALLKLESTIENATAAVTSMSLLQMPTEKILHGKIATSGPKDDALLLTLDSHLGSSIRNAQVVVRDAIKNGVEARKLAGISDYHVALHRSDLYGGAHLPDSASNAISTLVSQMQSLQNLMPLASKTLIFARTEISKLSKNLDSIFNTFADKGPPIFTEVAQMWQMAFTFYYIVMIPFPLTLLYYAFWAGGWFGGPGTVPDEAEAEALAKQEPKGYCAMCCEACCNCWIMYHDTTFCFWSLCIFLQVVTLFLFITSLLFCLISAIQIFMSSGCAQVYMINDHHVCGNTLLNLRKFLVSFLPGVHEDSMASQCQEKTLLTCNVMGPMMQSGAMLTVMGSLIAAGAAFQLIVESSTLHARAVVRREIAEIIKASKDK
jgi:Ca2+-binding EF-hand superfamily protein